MKCLIAASHSSADTVRKIKRAKRTKPRQLSNNRISQSEFVKTGRRIVVEILERQHRETFLFAIGDRRGQRSFMRVGLRLRSELRRAGWAFFSTAHFFQPAHRAGY